MALNFSLLTAHCSLKKSLLAFSAGIDSSALFFLLLENNIPFDIALVDYGTRDNSDKEEAHAKALAKKYHLTCHTTKAPEFKSHFEANARKFRYDFFESLIAEYRYDTLITAHQLNDQLEWFLMRLTKGAGLSELIGLEPVSRRTVNPDLRYTLIRPLLQHTKEELIDYLESNKYPYFIDESNQDTAYERNRFRKLFSDPLLAQYSEGIARSFRYLGKEKKMLQSGFELIFSRKELRVLQLDTPKLKAKAADLTLKELGYLLSADQRKEIEKHYSIVIGGKWAIIYQDHRLYIAPFLTTSMPKEFKELCRISNLPIKIRPYCYEQGIEPREVMAVSSEQ
ncbi:MAG: tRNA lysidine(34) synthetase TilS [Campylobacterota bacterium]|nr:tRNA lysidine(34) synthetase TilS [Campylobacterota bacterium]